MGQKNTWRDNVCKISKINKREQVIDPRGPDKHKQDQHKQIYTPKIKLLQAEDRERNFQATKAGKTKNCKERKKELQQTTHERSWKSEDNEPTFSSTKRETVANQYSLCSLKTPFNNESELKLFFQINEG
jgi:hypothetical protein